jgi:hypothetical protein
MHVYLYRLLVVAEKKIVYQKFPIPLINRLEKHFLEPAELLTNHRLSEVYESFSAWIEDFDEQPETYGTHYMQDRALI